MPRSARPVLRRLVPGLALLLGLILAGCAGQSAYDELSQARPSGSPFAQALFRDYAQLARSYGLADAPATTAFDSGEAFSVSGASAPVVEVAETLARKALIAAKGEEPLPEPAPTDNREADTLRMKLLRALDEGRTKAPAAAARAQVDFDCWVLNSGVDELAASAARCRAAFTSELANLGGAGTPPPAPAPQTSDKTREFTVYFALGSAQLDSQAMAVLRQVISTARAGRQSHISAVGHTDTVGSEAYNLTLSKRRGEAVRDALVQMGARAAAIEVTGTGQKNLAVPTPDGVPNPKNRRAVITLTP